MEITVERNTLLKPLQAISSIVDKKQTLPILSNTLLSISNDQLLLSATDLEIEIVGFVRIESQIASKPITVSARKLFDICRTLPEAALLCLSSENDENHLMVRSNESCFVLNTLSAHDFPALEEDHYPIQLTIKQGYLKHLLTKTYFAMGQQDVRHYLNGTFLDIGQCTIKSVAADGHRLALTTIYTEEIGDVKAQVLLPRKSILEMIRLLDGDFEQALTISINDNRFRMVTSDFIFTTKLINAQYPDYNRLIPRGTMSAIGDREAIKQALIRASILSNEKFRGVRFELDSNKLRIFANNADQEQADDSVSLEYAGHPMEIAFNAGYWLDAISAIATNRIRCIFTDPSQGVLIEPVILEDQEDGMENSTGLYVVMPMRL